MGVKAHGGVKKFVLDRLWLQFKKKFGGFFPPEPQRQFTGGAVLLQGVPSASVPEKVAPVRNQYTDGRTGGTDARPLEKSQSHDVGRGGGTLRSDET